ncbi:hypothetical protein AB0I16_33360 [Streptomyces sp. NPDC050703]|uniref:hypothetical protein n=1 Tax=Streptomyces sp. NPDC050703 TaxID=3157218 RepID=UPI00343B9FE3
MRHTFKFATAATALLVLTGCGGNEADAETKPTKAAPAVKPAPSPDTAQTAALMTELRKIKPELAADEERAVRRARNVCTDIKGDKPATLQASNANARYSGGTAGQLTDEQGAKIVAAVKATFCK